MLIDLSILLNEQTAVYPGDPKLTIKPVGILEKDGYNDAVVTFGNHNGTHIDAPLHMVSGGKTLDQFPIYKFIGRGVLINVLDKITTDSVISANIEKDDIVLFYTGMSHKFNSEEYFTNSPELTEEIAEYLVQKQVKMVGVDMGSIDHDPYPIHKILLKNDILVIENLMNLSLLDGKSFTVYAFPLNLQLDGSPARVVAQLEK